MPVPDLSTSQLEHLSDRSMPGRERTWVDGWVCRAADGVTSRANCCTPLGPIGDSISATVDAVDSWYRGRDLPTVFQLWEGADFAITTELDRRGYTTIEGAEVMARTLHDAPTAPASGHRIELDDGLERRLAVEDDADRLAELALSPLTKIVAGCWDGSRLRCSGVGVLDGAALGVFAMSTAPADRRQGLASSILAALLGEAVARDLDVAWLQVAPSNTGAKQLYERFGFATAHAYHYRAAPPLGLS
ncbi:MAG: GNAT family N-acetyltransferase [Acidimicrobiales bacterium]